MKSSLYFLLPAAGVLLLSGSILLFNFTVQAQSLSSQPLDYHRAEMEYRAMIMRDENGKIPDNALLNGVAQKNQLAYNAAPWQAPGTGFSPVYGPGPVGGISSNAWTSIGPGNVGGRVRSILINPTNTSIMWLGSVGGGVWKTANGGASWFPLNDFMANLAIGCLVMDPLNPNVIYAGTGEGFDNLDGQRGAGIFQTTDGGATWTQLPATANASFYYVNRLSICPTNDQIILAATGTGIWRSTDGGTSWNSQYNANAVLDIAFDPSGGNGIASGSTYGSGMALYSTDAGVTWTQATGLPTGGRIEVAYAMSSPNIVYAGANNNSGEVYVSNDGGQTYSLQNTGNNYMGNQGWYDNCIWVDPTNPNVVVVGGTDIWRSTDGGVTFTDIGGYSGGIHPDQHAIVNIPTYDGSTVRTVFIGNDGGIFQAGDIYTTSSSSGWTSLVNNVGITQFYGGAGNNTSGTIIGGAQDNGTPRYTPTSGSNAWSSMVGGDGGYCAADPTDANYFYGEYIYLDIYRSTDAGASANNIYTGIGDAGVASLGGDPDGSNPKITRAAAANFIAPFVLDPNNPNTLLGGGSNLWRSTNAKAPTPSWANIKNGANGSYISAIAVAPGNSDIIWVGHNNGDVYSTTNGTSANPTWVRKDLGAPNLPNRVCTRLTIDPNNWNRVFATFGGFSSDNVYVTTDGGSTWANISSGLPSVPLYSLVIAPFAGNFLYVGSEIGVFASANGGATWSPGNEGAANAEVDELFWMGNTLVAVTHGRGMFQIAVPPEPLQVSAGSLASTGYIGGPFNNTNVNFVLTNVGSSSLNWSLINTSAWLQASSASDTLTPGGAAVTVSVGLSSAATNLAVGNYAAMVLFTNLSDGVVQYRQFALQIQPQPDPLQITPSGGLTFGGTTGYLAGASQSFGLTNTSGTSINWSLAGSSPLFNAAPRSGTLAGGAGTIVTVTLAAAANALAVGSYTNNLSFTNLHDSVVQICPVIVVANPFVLNGGFETGDFSYWTESGDFSYCTVVNQAGFVHSGRYGAQMGPANVLSYLSQNVSTTPGQIYLLSCWLNTPDGQTPNEFTASWNGSVLVDQVNLTQIGWTNYQFFVTATGNSTPIQFGFRDDPTYLGFDDVSVVQIPPPVMQNTTRTGASINFSWSTQPGLMYQLQYTTNLTTANWINLGGTITATNNSLTITDSNTVTALPWKFYRLQMLP